MKAFVTRQSFISAAMMSMALLSLFFCRGLIAPYDAERVIVQYPALGGIMARWLAGIPWLEVSICIFLALVSTLRVTRIVTANMLLSIRTFLPMVLFTVLAFGVFIVPRDVNAMLGLQLFILSSARFIYGFRRGYEFETIFIAGLWMGLIPLVFPAGTVMWAVIPVALMLFRRSVRESIICIIGLSLPLAIYSYVCWIMGGEFLSTSKQIIAHIISPSALCTFEQIDAFQWVLSVLCLLIVMASLFTFLRQIKITRTRPLRVTIYFIFTIIFALTGFALPCAEVTLSPFVGVGAAVIASCFFVRYQKTFSAIIYWLLILTAVAVNFGAMV